MTLKRISRLQFFYGLLCISVLTVGLKYLLFNVFENKESIIISTLYLSGLAYLVSSYFVVLRLADIGWNKLLFVIIWLPFLLDLKLLLALGIKVGDISNAWINIYSLAVIVSLIFIILLLFVSGKEPKEKNKYNLNNA